MNSKSSRPPEAASGGRLSNRIEMDQWLKLLVVLFTGLVALAWLAAIIWIGRAIGHTVLLFALGGLLAYALDPVVWWIQRGARPAPGATAASLRPSRTRSALLLFGALALLLLASAALLGQQAGREIRYIALDHQAFVQGVRPAATPAEREQAKLTLQWRAHLTVVRAQDWLLQHGIHADLEAAATHPDASVRSWAGRAETAALRTVAGIGRAAVESLVVALIALYFLIYGAELRERANGSLPPEVRVYAEQWEQDVSRILGGFVRGQLILALVMGGLAAAACLAIGIHIWLLIGLFVVIASLIPVVGPYIGAVPAVLAAAALPASGLMTPLVRVIIVLLVFIGINETGSKILYPRLVGEALGMHEVLVLFMLLAGFEVGGLVGVLFAAPLSALAVATVAQLVRLWRGLPPATVAPTR